MSGNVKQFVDFTGNTNNDTGENNAASIQPMADGEGVSGTVLARPSESLRQRTEAIRDVMTDSLYLRDSDRNFVAFCLGGITWPGSTTTSASGIPVLTNTLWLVPILTPGTLQGGLGALPIASFFGVLHLKRSSDSANAISVTSRRRSYAAGDQINVTVVSGASFSCALDVEIGLRRTIKIVATGTTTLGAVITALNGLIPPAPDNTQLVTAALEGGASSGDFLLVPQARQLVTGNYDAEGHQIVPATMSGFFASNPTQALAEGDTLCIRYDMMTDLASTGGRRQSLVENSNTSVPAGSLFNSRVHPEFLVNALPVCKVLLSKLVFGTGIEVPAGAVNFPLSGSAQGITYSGGPNWADGTTNPAASVETQLDKIITDLGSGSGTAKIAGAAAGPTSDVPAGTLFAQIGSLITLINDTKNQNAVRLLDGLAAQLVPGDLGAAANPEMRNVTAGSDGTGTEWCYAATISAGIPIQGSSNNIVRISSGTVFQRVPSSPQATFISFTLPGTDQFTIANGNGVNPRADLIQIRLQWTGVSPSSVVSATVNVKTGTPGAIPAYPAPDTGFVPICYVVSGKNYTGTGPFNGDLYLDTTAVVHDQRMPLGVKVYTVYPVNMMYNDDAWTLSGKAGDVIAGGNPGFKRNIRNISALTSQQDRVIIPCPTNRGRLIGVGLVSEQGNSALGFIETMFESSGFGDSIFPPVNLITNGASPSFKRVGLETLEVGGGITPLTPGGGIPRKAYGSPIWCDGTKWHTTTRDTVNITSPGLFDSASIVDYRYIAYVHSNVFNSGTPTKIHRAVFYVAEGIG
jgi:hypothetical protein